MPDYIVAGGICENRQSLQNVIQIFKKSKIKKKEIRHDKNSRPKILKKKIKKDNK